MSLNEHFSQRAQDAHSKKIEDACTRLLRQLQDDIARAKKLADGEGGLFTRHGFHGEGDHETGVLKYRLARFRSKGSATFDVWYQSGQAMDKLLKKALPRHPAFLKLHEFCARAENDIRIDYSISDDMSAGMITHTHYVFTIDVTVKLREPYKKSQPMLVSPPSPKPAPQPARVIPPPAPPVAASKPALTKAQVRDYLKNLKNEDDKREFIALLGGVSPHKLQRVQLKKPKPE